jgi:hypothetical protein
MSFSTFLTSSLISLVLLFIIVKCWKIILIIGYSLYIIGHLAFWYLMTTIIWHAIIINNINGWFWTWLYLFLLLIGIIVAYVLIAFEIIDIAFDWIRNIIRTLR